MSVVLLGSTSGSVTLQEPAVAGSTVIDLPATSGTMAVLPTATSVLPQASGGTGTTTGYYGFKNRIINGAMVIDQRNAGGIVTPTSSATAYATDRWALNVSQNSKLTAQQSSAFVGFTNSLLITSSSAYPVASGDYFMVDQNIEGLNVGDLGWGTANAQTVTLSFKVKSSLTGTFGGVISNSANNRSYPFSYTISSANTETSISVTIAGDTSGTWLTTNGVGIRVRFSMGVGSTYQGTAGAWAGATYLTATGATSVVGTNTATWQVTGVQLEKGSTATSFDYRPYGTELALCQRYYWKAMNGTNQHMAGTAYYFSATEINMAISCPMPMRATPTLEQVTGTDFYFFTGVVDTFDGWTGLQLSSPTTNPTQINLYVTSGVSGTSGRAGGIRTNNASSSVAFTAEL